MDTEDDAGISRRKQKVIKDEPPKVAELPLKPQRTIRKTGLTAYVVFLDESSLSRALALASSQKPRPWPSTPDEEPSGLAHYLTVYQNQRPPLDSIRDHVDTYMELFEYKAAKERQKSKYRKGEAIVDEDGFTLVTRGGAYGKTLGGGVSVATKQFQRSGATSSRARPKKKKEKEGFYAFQKAEKQRSELLNLKKRWEEDKAKVEKLRASRRFKPY
ncbi:ribosomal RNA-processing protein 7-domain-containing protein [Coprinopsis sp. MPI-PUGE-AT-0042]|nr:ribosomal RNA-processing protein 7-domain-containing protein [Coprinopsis sp. MPI-PUGE-AT-0042]